MNNRSNIEEQVMASVAVIYTTRKLVSRTALKLYVFLLSVVGITFFVSVPHITQNFEHVARGGVGSIMNFLVTALLSTTLVVQVAVLLGVLALFSLIFDVVRSFTTSSHNTSVFAA
jgi:hypothetical protein